MQADKRGHHSMSRQPSRMATDSAMHWHLTARSRPGETGHVETAPGVGRSAAAKASSVLVIGIVLAVALVAVIPHVFSMALTPPAAQYVEVTVMPGQTLWQIASEHKAERTDTRRMIDRIRTANELSNASVYPGQILRIPVAP